jgi:hypothetical protein
MSRSLTRCALAVLVLFLVADCSGDMTTYPSASPTGATLSAISWGPETPNFNLEVILRGEGFGLVKFRQPNDADQIVYLDTKVRDLAPNTSYELQRAVDATVDDNCTSDVWLTLGKGSVAHSITTDEKGTG